MARVFNPPSDRAALAIGTFAALVTALDEGRWRQADREQDELRRLGFDINVRPLRDPAPSAREGGGR